MKQGGALVALLAAWLAIGCSSAPQIVYQPPAPPVDAGTEAGGNTSWVDDAGTQDAVVTPSGWGSLGVADHCTFLNVPDPTRYQLFKWAACNGVANCEVARFNPLPPDQTTFYEFDYGGVVNDDGTATRAVIHISDSLGDLVFVTDAAGRLLNGYRISGMLGYGDECYVGVGLWNDHFGVLASPVSRDNGTFGLIYGTAGQHAVPRLVIAQGYWAGPWIRMGESRWAETMNTVTTFSNVTGEDGYDVSGSGRAENLRVAGNDFLFQSTTGSVVFGPSEIDFTDGILPAKPYLVPSDGSDYVAPAYANSYVFWLRGVDPNRTDGTFGHVEVWDSPYSPDPAQLAPEKLGDSPVAHSPGCYDGGWGRYAEAIGVDAIEVWNAASKTTQMLALPAGWQTKEILGLTRDHLWITATRAQPRTNMPEFVVRYALH